MRCRADRRSDPTPNDSPSEAKGTDASVARLGLGLAAQLAGKLSPTHALPRVQRLRLLRRRDWNGRRSRRSRSRNWRRCTRSRRSASQRRGWTPCLLRVQSGQLRRWVRRPAEAALAGATEAPGLAGAASGERCRSSWVKITFPPTPTTSAEMAAPTKIRAGTAIAQSITKSAALRVAYNSRRVLL